MLIENLIRQEMDKIYKEGLKREIPNITKSNGKYIEVNGVNCLNCASNDYLGLGSNKEIKKSAQQAIKIYGNSAGGSRIVSGNYYIYEKLEKEMAKFKGYESCLVVNSGYVANILILNTLLSKDSVVFMDKLNHASIYDGIKKSEATVVRYRHNDIEHLEKLLKKHSSIPLKFLITDTIFSMDGDRAKLLEIAELKKLYNFTLIVDEAHATGIYGKGRGLCHHIGVQDLVDINMGTFSKALGGYGAYICSSKLITELFVNKGRPFIYTTALPPAVIGGNLKALEIIQEKYDNYGGKLLNLIAKFREILKKNHITFSGSDSQIFPIVFKTNEEALSAHKKLIEYGIFTGIARRPTVQTPRLRISLRADFTKKDLMEIASCLKKVV